MCRTRERDSPRRSRTLRKSLSAGPSENTKSAFFYSQFWNENGQNVKCARSFIPHSHSGMDRTPFHPFCSQEQNERNVANENQRWRTAGRVLSIQARPYRTYRRKNLDILLGKMKLYFLSHYTKSTRRISVMFPYLLRKVYSCQVCYAMSTRARTAHPDGRFFM